MAIAPADNILDVDLVDFLLCHLYPSVLDCRPTLNSPLLVFRLLSTFHGPFDPDGVETAALRPIATLVYHLQGTVFGDHIILQRAFVTILMGGFLWSVGLLLRETGLSFRHIVVVLVLFASSRVFASLVLRLAVSHLILAYTFMVLTALFYLRWIKRDCGHLLALTFGFAALAVFTREEAYTLPVALPLLWWLSSPHKSNYRRPIAVALGVAAIVALQYILRAVFVPDAPQPVADRPALAGTRPVLARLLLVMDARRVHRPRT